MEEVVSKEFSGFAGAGNRKLWRKRAKEDGGAGNREEGEWSSRLIRKAHDEGEEHRQVLQVKKERDIFHCIDRPRHYKHMFFPFLSKISEVNHKQLYCSHSHS